MQRRGVPPRMWDHQTARRRSTRTDAHLPSSSHLTGTVHTSTSLPTKWGGPKLYGMGQHITMRSTHFC
ncbi:hypothetical protein PISMIDRAFT_688801 [Pisolithus microcarpus 441]|uniref:Uncharacterized protein n=1 Tax=Pisolithus microcarpus 441 TaxID=765257 RepID=A0A0C9YZQ7_9AGAM|nr:hypothetical protein PISMIDRAFT_688801 [Pisolithus microcarpus 441]